MKRKVLAIIIASLLILGLILLPSGKQVNFASDKTYPVTIDKKEELMDFIAVVDYTVDSYLSEHHINASDLSKQQKNEITEQIFSVVNDEDIGFYNTKTAKTLILCYVEDAVCTKEIESLSKSESDFTTEVYKCLSQYDIAQNSSENLPLEENTYTIVTKDGIDQASFTALNNDFHTLLTDYEGYKENTNLTVLQLQSSLKKMTKKLSGLKQNSSVDANTISTLSSRIDTLNTVVDALDNNTKETLQSQQTALNDIKSTICALQEARKSGDTALQQSIDQLTIDYATAVVGLRQQHDTYVANNETTIKELQQKVTELEQSASNSNSNSNSNTATTVDTSALQNQIDTLQASLVQTNSDLDVVENELTPYTELMSKGYVPLLFGGEKTEDEAFATLQNLIASQPADDRNVETLDMYSRGNYYQESEFIGWYITTYYRKELKNYNMPCTIYDLLYINYAIDILTYGYQNKSITNLENTTSVNQIIDSNYKASVKDAISTFRASHPDAEYINIYDILGTMFESTLSDVYSSIYSLQQTINRQQQTIDQQQQTIDDLTNTVNRHEEEITELQEQIIERNY